MLPWHIPCRLSYSLSSPQSPAQALHRAGAPKLSAAQQVTLIVTHVPADCSSCFLVGRQLPWSKRNARTLPRQTWASLSTDSQLADSRAIHRVRTGPPRSRPATARAGAWRAKGGVSVPAALCFSRWKAWASRAEVPENRILPPSPDSVAS